MCMEIEGTVLRRVEGSKHCAQRLPCQLGTPPGRKTISHRGLGRLPNI